MFPNRFHLSLVASAYGIAYRSAVWRARKLGISGYEVTNEEAFDIANYGEHKVQIIVVQHNVEIIHSKLNNTALENL